MQNSIVYGSDLYEIVLWLGAHSLSRQLEKHVSEFLHESTVCIYVQLTTASRLGLVAVDLGWKDVSFACFGT